MPEREDHPDRKSSGRLRRQGDTDRVLELERAYEASARALAEWYADPQVAPHEKLHVATERGDIDLARRLIEEGADVNWRPGPEKLPPIHLAAGYVYREVIDALLASGRCDLTARDFMGRLPSDIVPVTEPDLADRLAEEQARQFREKNMDPRRPTHPDYGNWLWED